MTFEPFSKLPNDALRFLLRAYSSKEKGWTDEDYKACYLAFTEKLRGQHVPAKQFDALVRFWGDKHRTKTYDIGADKRNTRIIPNKMIRHGWTTKGIAEQKSPLQSQSPFAKAYSQDISDVVDYTRKAMVGENLV